MHSEKTKNKKEEFLKQDKKRLPLILTSSALILISLALIIWFGFNGKTSQGGFGDPIAPERSYIGKLVSMTDIMPDEEEASITIPLDTVIQNSIVYFELENNENQTVPLMAYITPSGRLFAGSSMCEPCRGRKFSLAGESLVCDTCRTTYDIETHEFLSGSRVCGSFPPVYMNPEVDNGIITIDIEEILNWRIRS